MTTESPKTEKEILEEGVRLSVLLQRLDELSVYIDKLIVRMNVEMKRDRIGSIVYLVSWVVWVVLDLIFPWGRGVWVLLFVFGLVYSSYTTTKLLRTFSELDGVFTTLRILGMMDNMPDHPKKKRRWVMDEMIEAVRSWVEKKVAARKSGYQPA